MTAPTPPAGRGLLAGKHVLVTAAAGTGIGNATARRCLEEGASLVVADKHERRLADTAEELGVPGVPCDVTVEEDVQRLFAAGPPRPQHVQRDPGHHRGQPAAEVVHLAGVGPAQPQPGLLDGVVRLADRAQHPVRDRLQVAPVVLETLRQPVVAVHGHILRSRSVIPLTIAGTAK